MLYIDGCSYTHGHDEQTFGTNWSRLICPGLRRQNFSRVAKSNDSIFADFIASYNYLKEGDYYVIYWSHSERCINGAVYDNNIELNDTKNLNPNMPWGLNWFKDWLGYLIKTACYMKSVVDMCAVKGVKPRFITTEHYYWFKYVNDHSKYNFIDSLIPYTFNWPAEDIRTYHEIDFKANKDTYSFKEFSLYWALTNTTLSLARSFSIEYNLNMISEDCKHLSLDGHKKLAIWLERFILDSEKDLHFLLTHLSPVAARAFKDPLAGYKFYNQILNTKHWVERFVSDSALEISKRSADFIYE